MRRHALLVLTLLCGVAATSAPQNPEPFLVRDVTLDVTIDYDSSRLAGAYTAKIENWTARPAARFSFALHRLLEVQRISDEAGRPVRFTQDVRRFSDDPIRQVNQVDVTLPRPVAAGARTTLRIEYSGYVTPYTEVGWLYVKDHIDTAFTILRADALAFPEIQGLNDEANRRRPRPDFTYRASVRVPAGYVVASGGTLQRSANADGSMTWSYSSGRPSPFLNIAIAPYDTMTVPGLRIFYFAKDSAGARHLAVSGDRALRLFTEWFGPLRDSPTVTMIEIPDGFGSQASLVGGIIQEAAAFRDTGLVNQMYHELAHLWNAVGDGDVPSPRWNEGLSSFLEDLAKEQLNGWAGRPASEQRVISRLRQRIASDSLLRTVPLIDYGKRGVTGNSYSVGKIMFAALYQLIGPKDFARIFAEYYRQHPAGGTTRDLVELATRATAVDLASFFQDWIFTPGWTAVLSQAKSVDDVAQHYRRLP